MDFRDRVAADYGERNRVEAYAIGRETEFEALRHQRHVVTDVVERVLGARASRIRPEGLLESLHVGARGAHLLAERVQFGVVDHGVLVEEASDASAYIRLLFEASFRQARHAFTSHTWESQNDDVARLKAGHAASFDEFFEAQHCTPVAR